MEKIKFGIIGFGFMGPFHEMVLTEHIDDAEVVAICDIDKDRMDKSVTKGVLKFTDYNDLLAVDEIDSVIVVIPNHLHKDCVIAAANAGKNVICEKPVALNCDELDEMIEAVEKNDVRFTVHHQRRFDQDFTAMKEVYNQNLVGKVYTVKSMLYGYNGNVHDWHVYKKFGGGMIYDWGVHLFDQILNMVEGKITTVYADVRNVINEEVDDYYKVIINFENGVAAEVELGTYYLADKENWFERHWFMGGDKGSAYNDGFGLNGKIVKTTRLLGHGEAKRTMEVSGPTRSFGTPDAGVLDITELPEGKSGIALYIQDYINALKTGREFYVKIEEVKRVMELIDAIRESSETKQTVVFNK